MQRITKLFTPIAFSLSISLFAQEHVIDSTKNTKLDEVIVTGQIEPQSIKKSVFNVRVISKEDIQRQAANNLGDVLNQYLNIVVRPNSSDGRSSVSMFGLDGQYFKILVDNVPMVSDTGLGNNVDLTQINLDDVEQLEIIEGSMGVTHGANAVSGVINIITKKSTKNKWDITATVQEETIGNEYEPLGKEGRHIQALRAAHEINDNWFFSIGANRNDFQGFKDNRGGKDFTENTSDIEYQRGYSWLPKEQFFTNALIRYQKNGMRLFYRFEYLNEDIDYYNPIVSNEFSEQANSVMRISTDRRYYTDKFYHHLNGVGKLFSTLDYNVSLSYQTQQRELEQFKYYIQTGEEANNETKPYQETDIIYSTGTLSNFFKEKKYDLQFGYEFVNTNGYSSSVTGLFNPTENSQNTDRRLENYDFFGVAEISLSDRFSIRPGYRYSFQSKFDDQWAGSFGMRYLFNHNIEARASYGRSYRTPNYDELYTYFVDANHNVQGNEQLIPETSNSAEASIKKMSFFDSGLKLSNNINFAYMAVNDRIELAVVQTTPMLESKYINISKYQMWNVSTGHQVGYKNLSAKVGFTIAGISRKIDNGLAVSDDKFLTNYQFNANLAYTVPKWKTTFSAFYKLNGKQQQYIESTDASSGDVIYVLQELESFGLLDASVKKTFFDKTFDVTLGARNLLNIVNVRSNIGASDAHTTGSTNNLLGYGRSFFLKLTYNINL
ncbi:TonB-dependent receptor [Flavobacterium rakeshii]|uniref:TonB-dependent receptor plug domain-containing protein n=1 Tax=Flavobacterium rakeshii TaxID=1038845 RepID=UPI002E7B7E77|nr:TonB-dependent receptor [Flavobacterium rakeshii]MEE1897237.1 TonB-dependent receptor [Flavobacterium rakeshii]